jgi:hypothetical protein
MYTLKLGDIDTPHNVSLVLSCQRLAQSELLFTFVDFARNPRLRLVDHPFVLFLS